MEHSAIGRTQNRDAAKRGSGGRNRSEARIRVVAIWVAALALLGIGAALYDATHVPTAHAACVRKTASGEHAMLEAFFQNPPDANALAKIERACAK